jgi:hypothetical protein
MTDVVRAIQKRSEPIGYEQRVFMFVEIIKAFEDMDCDTLEECAGNDSAFDDALERCGYDLG